MLSETLIRIYLVYPYTTTTATQCDILIEPYSLEDVLGKALINYRLISRDMREPICNLKALS